jgi:aminoglycoside phosphotransferase (APT) family kinase protein
MNSVELKALLHQRGLIADPGARCTPLGGGVSSDIWLVEEGANQFVVKRALPKLRVQQDWFADVSRNRHEQDFMDYVAGFLPDAVPRILHRAPELGFFTMEYLGKDFQNWKTILLAGRPDIDHARKAAAILAEIHRHSWDDPVLRARFATTPQFFQLRLEPYLLNTGQRYSHLDSLFVHEADRLAASSLCLVHGDFSPKNILIGPERVVLLDCEVAWFGDPAFDIAFLLNHFFLKALLFHDNPRPYLALAETTWQTYRSNSTVEQLAGLEERVCRLVLMLLLARIDGKSPVEYLSDQQKKDCVRSFVANRLRTTTDRLGNLCGTWENQIGAIATCQEALGLDKKNKAGKPGK